MLDLTGTLVDQPFVVQIWLMANAVFVWMGSGADKPRLRCARQSYWVQCSAYLLTGTFLLQHALDGDQHAL